MKAGLSIGGPILHHFRDMVIPGQKIHNFSQTPHLTSLLGISPFKFLDEPYIPITLSINEDHPRIRSELLTYGASHYCFNI